MTEIAAEGQQSIGPLDALRAELDHLRQRVAISDEEIDLLQLEAARNSRKWYREGSVLVAVLALIVSMGTLVVGQINIATDRQIQDRDRLSALIEQLPAALAQAREKPSSPADLVFLVAGGAADLIDKLGLEMSTASEKIEVATALVVAFDLPRAKRLATDAERQSTNAREKILANQIIANINFQIGDFVGGRDVYRRVVGLLQTPQNELDSSLLRDYQMVHVELTWAGDELSLARNCQEAMKHTKNAKQALDRQPQDRVDPLRMSWENSTKTITAGCSP
jgi:hypothetical protein